MESDLEYEDMLKSKLKYKEGIKFINTRHALRVMTPGIIGAIGILACMGAFLSDNYSLAIVSSLLMLSHVGEFFYKVHSSN